MRSETGGTAALGISDRKSTTSMSMIRTYTMKINNGTGLKHKNSYNPFKITVTRHSTNTTPAAAKNQPAIVEG
jgi:hypothetical protein